MSDTPRQPPADRRRPAPRPLTSLALTVALLAVVLGALVAVTHPVVALATAALVVTTASAARHVRRSRVRRATARRVCIPVVDVCVLV